MSIVSSMESEGRYLSLLHLAQRIVDRRDGVPLLPSDAGPSSSHVSTSVLAAKEQRSGDEVSSFEPLGVDGDAPSPPSSSNPSNTSTQTVNGVVEMTQRKRILSALRFTGPLIIALFSLLFFVLFPFRLCLFGETLSCH